MVSRRREWVRWMSSWCEFVIQQIHNISTFQAVDLWLHNKSK